MSAKANQSIDLSEPLPIENCRHRLVITGATGTLGRNLLEEVSSWKDTRVLALLRPGSRPLNLFKNVFYQSVNFYDHSSLLEIIKQFSPTSMVHCAATGMQFPKSEWFEMVRFNVDVSLRLCEVASKVPGCNLIYISTGLVYRNQGRPLREDDPIDTLHPYGASKAAADILIRSAAAEFGVPLKVMRPFSFSGLGDVNFRLFPSLLRAASEGKSLDLSLGDQIRDHCAAGDIARGIALAIRANHNLRENTSIFNLGSGSSITLKELIQNVVAELGIEVQLNFGKRDYSRFEPKNLQADISRAIHNLEWTPRINFAYAVWELACESFPTLRLQKPKQFIS